MKIIYENEQVRLDIIGLHKSKPHLYNLYEEHIKKAKFLDYDEFILWCEEENGKTNDYNIWIQELQHPICEFRLPPPS